MGPLMLCSSFKILAESSWLSCCQTFGGALCERPDTGSFSRNRLEHFQLPALTIHQRG
jgi:hypothetical protein